MLLNETETAKMIGMSVYWLRRKRWAGGGIPYIKLANGRGGAVRYRREDVDAFVSSKTRKNTSDPGSKAHAA